MTGGVAVASRLLLFQPALRCPRASRGPFRRPCREAGSLGSGPSHDRQIGSDVAAPLGRGGDVRQPFGPSSHPWATTADGPSELLDESAGAATSLRPGETRWITLAQDPQQADSEPTVAEVDQEGHRANVHTFDPASGEMMHPSRVRYRFPRGSRSSGWLALEDQGDGLLVLELERRLQVIDVDAGRLLGWRGWSGD